MPGSVLDTRDRMVGTDGVHALIIFHPVSQAWEDQSDRHRARDTGLVCCRSSGDLCGVKDNSRKSSGLQGLGGIESPPVPHSSPNPEGWSYFPIDMRKPRLREVKCITQEHTATLSDPGLVLFP